MPRLRCFLKDVPVVQILDLRDPNVQLSLIFPVQRTLLWRTGPALEQIARKPQIWSLGYFKPQSLQRLKLPQRGRDSMRHEQSLQNQAPPFNGRTTRLVNGNQRHSPTFEGAVAPHISIMSRRSQGITLIQALSAEEATRQPSAADWWSEQARKRGGKARTGSTRWVRLPPLFRLFPSASF